MKIAAKNIKQCQDVVFNLFRRQYDRMSALCLRFNLTVGAAIIVNAILIGVEALLPLSLLLLAAAHKSSAKGNLANMRE